MIYKDNDNSRTYQSPPQPPALTVNDLVNFHNYFVNLKEKSPHIIACINHLEDCLYATITGIKMGIRTND